MRYIDIKFSYKHCVLMKDLLESRINRTDNQYDNIYYENVLTKFKDALEQMDNTRQRILRVRKHAEEKAKQAIHEKEVRNDPETIATL